MFDVNCVVDTNDPELANYWYKKVKWTLYMLVAYGIFTTLSVIGTIVRFDDYYIFWLVLLSVYTGIQSAGMMIEMVQAPIYQYVNKKKILVDESTLKKMLTDNINLATQTLQNENYELRRKLAKYDPSYAE